MQVPQAKCCLLGHSAFYQALFVHADYVSHICQVVCLHLAPHGIDLFLQVIRDVTQACFLSDMGSRWVLKTRVQASFNPPLTN